MAIIIPKASSNKPKTNRKLTNPASPPSATPGLIPFIDKLSVVFTPANDEDAVSMHTAMKAAFTEKSIFKNAFIQSGGFNEAKIILLPQSVQTPLIQYKYQKGRTQKIRLEFNPRKLGSDGLKELHIILKLLLYDGWNEFAELCSVTRIDVAVDLLHKRPEDFLMVKDLGVTSRSWSRDGEMQSIALGGSGGNQSLVYNVKAKRLNKNQPWAGHANTRVECRIRKFVNPKLEALGELPNPFVSILMLPSMPTAPSVGDPKADKAAAREWSRFMDSVKVRGINPALGFIPPKRRTEYRKHLKANALPWWDPEKIWVNWPKALEILKI